MTEENKPEDNKPQDDMRDMSDMADMPASPSDDQTPEHDETKALECAEPESSEDNRVDEQQPTSDDVQQEADDKTPEPDAEVEGAAAVPGTPANTATVLHTPPPNAATPPLPGSIEPSKTASTTPAAGVPILDSNHTLSHIPPRDSTPL